MSGPGKHLALAAALALAMAAPAWAAGQLEVRTQPAGAMVYLDDRYVGTSPLLIDAPPGRHRLTVHKDGHEATGRTVAIVDGLTTRSTLTLAARAQAELRVTSEPKGAIVYLGGERVGVTPLLVRGVAPGRHRVVLARAGYARAVSVVEVPAGLTRSLHLPLRPAPAPRPAVAAEKPKAERPKPPAPRAAAPKPVPTKRPARPPVVQAPAAAPPVAAPPVVAPVAPVVPAAPEVVTPVATPAPAPAPALPVEPRTVLFAALMAALAGGVGAYAWRRRRPQAGAPLVHPPRPARGVMLPTSGVPGPIKAALEREDWPAAATALWAAIEAGPAEAWHYYHLGLALERMGRPNDADGAYRTAMQADPTHPAATFNMAALHAAAEQLPLAVIGYRRHLEAHPDDVDALFNLGHLYMTLGMHAQALVHWTAARKLAPGDAAIKANCRFLRTLARAEVRKAG